MSKYGRFRKNGSTDAGALCNFLMLCRRMASFWTFCETINIEQAFFTVLPFDNTIA